MSSSRALTSAAITDTYVWMVVGLFFHILLASSYCEALSSASSRVSSTTFPTSALTSIGKSQLAVLDGAEWNSVQTILREELESSSKGAARTTTATTTTGSTKYGYMTVVTGRDGNNRRVVAMQYDGDDSDGARNSNNLVYEDSIAVLPEKISDSDAIATFITCLSSVHCALPKVEKVGGGNDSIAAGKAVVLGSSDVACFAAEGLASLGIDVFLVNPKGSANVKTNVGRLEVVKPMVGPTQTGFAAHIGQFDTLVDTIGNERSGMLTYDGSNNDDDDDDDDDVQSSFFGGGTGGSVLQLLKTRHNCCKYVSTLTHSQDMIAKEGIFGGPGKADQYSQAVGSLSYLATNRDCRTIPPPQGLGRTLETLLQKGVVFSDKQRKKLCSKKSDAIRGWTLADFWEQTSWPRDSSGTGTLRFGLPAREELQDEVDAKLMISESPFRQQLLLSKDADVDDGYDPIGGSDRSFHSQAIQDNPFVLNVVGVNGVEQEIVKAEKDCIMFLSARFCKTCKQINPVYTRMARINQEKSNSNLSFVKAEASGSLGKELGQHLSVRAVPAFVFYRKGKRFGIPLSVSRLPSRKIDRALELLTSGAEWDDSILDES